MPDWVTDVLGLLAAALVATLLSLLFSVLDSWIGLRRRLRVKVGSEEIDLSPRNVRAAVDQLAKVASELREHPTVFLSYASPDRDFARQLVADLEEHGVRVWFPDREIAVGDSLSRRIADALEQTQWVVLVLSPDAMRSEWLQAELNMALREESRRDRPLILPVLYKGDTAPALLADRVYADFRSSHAAGLQSLLRAIRRQFESPVQRSVSKPDDAYIE